MPRIHLFSFFTIKVQLTLVALAPLGLLVVKTLTNVQTIRVGKHFPYIYTPEVSRLISVSLFYITIWTNLDWLEQYYSMSSTVGFHPMLSHNETLAVHTYISIRRYI